MKINHPLNSKSASRPIITNGSKMRANKSIVKHDFPNWKFCAEQVLLNFKNNSGLKIVEMRKVCSEHFALLDKIKAYILKDVRSFHVTFIYEMCNQAIRDQSVKYNIEDVVGMAESYKFDSNEFYSIFDISAREHIIVQDKIKEVLGIEPRQFNMQALLGFDPKNPLFHPEDLNHSIRYATIAYLVVSLPNCELKLIEDYFRVRFRIGTKTSTNKEIKRLQYVTIEKKGSFFMGEDANKVIPRRIFYRWSVFLESDMEGSRPYFTTDPVRSSFMSSVWYIFHSYLLDIHPKYIIMLHERQTLDRNKSIAASINAKIKFYSGRESTFDEHQIADCFTKTIRPKLAKAITIWEKLEVPIRINSDQQAVIYAKRLGLLPVPHPILEILYRL